MPDLTLKNTASYVAHFSTQSTRIRACLVIALLTALSSGLCRAAHAQATVAADNSPCYRWIDAATGKQVPTGPPGWSPTGASTYGGNGRNPDPNHVELGGKTFVKQPDGTWIDAATGKQVPTGPAGWDPAGAPTYGGRGSNPDPNHVELGGRTFVRVPCPAPTAATAGTAAAARAQRTRTPRLRPSHLLPPATVPRCARSVWIEADTGRRVADMPAASVLVPHTEDRPGVARQPGAGSWSWRDHAYNPETHADEVRVRGTWVDSATGKCVPSFPLDAVYKAPEANGVGYQLDLGWNPAYHPDYAYNPITKKTFLDVPLKPPAAPADSAVPEVVGDLRKEFVNGMLHDLPSYDISYAQHLQQLVDPNNPFAPKGDTYGWVDALSGLPAITTHAAGEFDPFDLHPDSLTAGGQTYPFHPIPAHIERIYMGGDDEDDDCLDDDEDRIEIAGGSYIRVLFPMQPPIAPAFRSTPDPEVGYPQQFGPYGLTLDLGGLGTTHTYDDGYKAGGTTLFLGLNAAYTWPIGNSFFAGTEADLLLPFQSSTVSTTETKLVVGGFFDAVAGVRLKTEGRPIDVWAGFGGGAGAVRSGYTSPSYSYSDTEPLPGIAVSAGASTPITRCLHLDAGVRYTNLFSGTFGAPGTTYSANETSFSGYIGLQWGHFWPHSR